MDYLFDKVTAPNADFELLARQKQAQLTKPQGSLGMLEEIAVRLSAMQQTQTPKIEKVWVSVFAADHGIAAENVSAFPQAVSVEMVKNFAAGGAAVNVLSRHVHADFEVIDVGLLQTLTLKNIVTDKSAQGTANFSHQAAMTVPQLNHALTAGKNAVKRAQAHQAQLFIGGEMGIANTSSASAIACALLKQSPNALTGAGTGLNSEAIAHKAQVIEHALKLHQQQLDNPLKVLQFLGGFEIAALVGAYIFAAQQQLPVLVDGFIATAAALVAITINREVQDWLIYAHQSEEKGHQQILQALNAKPLLNLAMRLGEASGAVVAVPLLQMACKLHNEMATFKQAHITTE
ncbi:MAG: nicotinate-nucleotide--dimethylbenzimidazole phosphoribosyltransferase [Methylococcaceae bacterium]|nr:nicotinate-nucleotide--dimethylbenzimidazole phosphoribosyltransferase [Methylococcaceae bacterium]